MSALKRKRGCRSSDKIEIIDFRQSNAFVHSQKSFKSEKLRSRIYLQIKIKFTKRVLKMETTNVNLQNMKAMWSIKTNFWTDLVKFGEKFETGLRPWDRFVRSSSCCQWYGRRNLQNTQSVTSSMLTRLRGYIFRVYSRKLCQLKMKPSNFKRTVDWALVL